MGSWLRVTNGFAFCAVFAGGSAGRRVSEATLDTARALRVRASGIQLDFAGGFVSLEDETTAGRFAAIVAAGPLVTGALALGSFLALKAFGWPLLDTPFEKTGAAVVAGEILSYVVFLNTIAFVLNLLPLPSLDGGKLLRALTSHA